MNTKKSLLKHQINVNTHENNSVTYAHIGVRHKK